MTTRLHPSARRCTGQRWVEAENINAIFELVVDGNGEPPITKGTFS